MQRSHCLGKAGRKVQTVFAFLQSRTHYSRQSSCLFHQQTSPASSYLSIDRNKVQQSLLHVRRSLHWKKVVLGTHQFYTNWITALVGSAFTVSVVKYVPTFITHAFTASWSAAVVVGVSYESYANMDSNEARCWKFVKDTALTKPKKNKRFVI